MLQLTDLQREQIAAEVELLAAEALDKLGLAESGFLVLVNGGRRQDVRQIHFHLLTEGYELAPALSDTPTGMWMDVPDPSCEVHQARTGDHPLFAGLTHAAETNRTLLLERRGYSIVWDARTRDVEGVVHLTAGEC